MHLTLWSPNAFVGDFGIAMSVCSRKDCPIEVGKVRVANFIRSKPHERSSLAEPKSFDKCHPGFYSKARENLSGNNFDKILNPELVLVFETGR